MKVRERPGGAAEAWVAALAELLGRRVDLDAAFASEEIVGRLIAASGGHVRDLLHLVRESLQRPWVAEEALPIPVATVEAVIRSLRGRRLPLRRDALELLRRVRRARSIHALEREDFAVLVTLFEEYLVLAYRNGELCYDVHPLTAEALDALDAGLEEE